MPKRRPKTVLVWGTNYTIAQARINLDSGRLFWWARRDGRIGWDAIGPADGPEGLTEEQAVAVLEVMKEPK